MKHLFTFVCIFFASISIAQITSQIIEGEFFWDTDPGFGSGNPLLALDGNYDNAIEELFKSGVNVNGLSVGPHSFKCRTKGSDGSWSSIFSVTIYIDSPLSLLTRSIKIVQSEYFWDTDPGEGMANPLLAIDGSFDSSVEEVGDMVLPTSSLSGGPHSLGIRTKGFDGVWSHVFFQTIFINCTSSVSPTVNINTQSTNICSGSEVTFTASVTNGGITPIYEWKKNGNNVGFGLSYISTSLQDGDVITCELTSNEPCAAPTLVLSNPIVINVSSPLVLNIFEETGILSATIGYSSYQWSLNNSIISGETNNTITAINNGLYSVEVFDSNACSATASYNYNSSGISLLELIDFTIYPNPSSEFVNIVFEKSENRQIAIYDVVGKLIYFKTSNLETVTIDVQDFISGVYNVVIDKQNKNKVIKKLIITN